MLVAALFWLDTHNLMSYCAQQLLSRYTLPGVSVKTLWPLQMQFYMLYNVKCTVRLLYQVI